ncbi:MAG: nucleotide exchange factor GrpE [Pseudonocardiaceae bacterium]|nr:nucleotide exchange factor GrpE [Pseudonocardiaceae bacterium]
MGSWFKRSKQAGGAEREDPPTSPTRLPTAEELAAHISGNGGTEQDDDASDHTVEAEQVTSDRQALIQLCLYALDRARSSGVAERIEHGLADVGVVALRPDGERFDPAVHEAGGAVPTDDASLDGLVAETEVVGFLDRNRVLRAPIVTVYTKNVPQ